MGLPTETTDPYVATTLEAPAIDPQEVAKQQREEEHRKSLFDYNEALVRLKALQSKWSGEDSETQRRRLLRNIDINPKALRDQGKLRPDETIIPIRMIDTNIRREQPSYINYLKGSQRLAIFKSLDNPQQDTQQLEAEFTNGMQYIGWETPHFKVLDGSQTHGWDSVEVVFDESKPLHVALEHVGHENLYFGMESLKTDYCEILIRKYSFSQIQLKLAIDDYGFDEKQVNLLLEKYADKATRTEDNVPVYKKFFKFKKCVYIAWYSDKEGCTDWLLSPKKLYLGRQHQVEVMMDVPVIQPAQPALGIPAQQVMIKQPQLQWQDTEESEFPIFLLPYSETEQQRIIDHKGRVFYDQYKQEGVTSIASGFCNSLNRSANVYGSVEGDPGQTSAPKQLDTELMHGKIYDRKVNFWGHNPPDPSTLRALQYFDVQNSEEVGQSTFAVNNRQDSRKTAKEIGAAEQQQALLSGVQVSLYSTFLRSTYSFIWKIVQSQALQGKIKLLLQPKEILDINQPTGKRIIHINNLEVIKQTFDIKAAGDVDVIQRAEMRSKMQQDWPVFSTTPLAQPFLQEYVRLSYPSMADKWLPLMQQADQLKQITAKLADMVMTLTNPEDIAALPPEAKQDIALTLQSAQQLIGNPAPEQTAQQ